jgi:hypothetical protein
MSTAQAASAVGGIALVVGFILLAIGFSRLRAEHLAPTKTIGQLQRDAAIARQQAGEDYESQRAA